MQNFYFSQEKITNFNFDKNESINDDSIAKSNSFACEKRHYSGTYPTWCAAQNPDGVPKIKLKDPDEVPKIKLKINTKVAQIRGWRDMVVLFNPFFSKHMPLK